MGVTKHVLTGMILQIVAKKHLFFGLLSSRLIFTPRKINLETDKYTPGKGNQFPNQHFQVQAVNFRKFFTWHGFGSHLKWLDSCLCWAIFCAKRVLKLPGFEWVQWQLKGFLNGKNYLDVPGRKWMDQWLGWVGLFHPNILTIYK